MTNLILRSKTFYFIGLTTFSFLRVIMVKAILKDFCQSTSIHGLSSIVEAKNSLIKRIAWAIIFTISISYAGNQLIENVDSKLTLST